MKFLNYLLAPIEGDDGKLSIRRLFAIILMLGLIRYTERGEPNPEVMWVFIMGIFMLLAIVTAQQVIGVVSGKGNTITPDTNGK